MATSSNILILKLGSTFSALRNERGDFENWITALLVDCPLPITTIDARSTERLPDHGKLAGVILTGSHAMVTDRHDWSERAAVWLRDVVHEGVPVLGICYGHQLLAHALGGTVEDTPQGPEFGTVLVNLTADAADDPLLGGLQSPLSAQVSHCQSVTRLPDAAIRLASSPRDRNHAFRYGSSAWGVQFHPEYTTEISSRYVERVHALLVGAGQNPDHIRMECRKTPEAATLLKRFAEIALKLDEDKTS